MDSDKTSDIIFACIICIMFAFQVGTYIKVRNIENKITCGHQRLEHIKADMTNQFLLILNNSYFKRAPNGQIRFTAIHTDVLTAKK